MTKKVSVATGQAMGLATAVSQRLEEEKGGHIFHQKVDWSVEVPWIELKVKGPIDG